MITLVICTPQKEFEVQVDPSEAREMLNMLRAKGIEVYLWAEGGIVVQVQEDGG
jgi:hypothetical protein